MDQENSKDISEPLIQKDAKKSNLRMCFYVILPWLILGLIFFIAKII